MIGCSKMDRENSWESALEQTKKKRGLKFNPGLMLIGLRTTEPRVNSVKLFMYNNCFEAFILKLYYKSFIAWINLGKHN